CGTRQNPCHCRILGPTVGVVALAEAAVVEWPVGAFVYCFQLLKGRRIFAHPAAVVYPRVSACFPISVQFPALEFGDIRGLYFVHFVLR
uniref:Uncharacterized protein n=1 Tax=Physcomitrium patens TaxID=3218 RepID=A0A7I3ZHH1_PHYPA